MPKNKSIILVPIYNEGENIDFIIDDLKQAKDCDVVFINDSSKDNSKELLHVKGATVINLPINLGIGGCIQTGYKYAYEKGYEIAIQYDGDGQHCASYAKNLIDEIEKGYDYVIGSRFVTKEGFQSTKARRIGIKMLAGIIRVLSGKKIDDVTSGFRACNRQVMALFVKYYPRDYPEPEVAGALAKNGYAISEIAVKMRKRQGGKSSIRPIKSIYYMIKVTVSIIYASFFYPKKGK